MKLLKLLKFQYFFVKISISNLEYNIFTNIQSILCYIIKVTRSSIQSNLVIRFSRMLQRIWKPGGIDFKKKKEKKMKGFELSLIHVNEKCHNAKKKITSLQFDEFVSIQCLIVVQVS